MVSRRSRLACGDLTSADLGVLSARERPPAPTDPPTMAAWLPAGRHIPRVDQKHPTTSTARRSSRARTPSVRLQAFGDEPCYRTRHRQPALPTNIYTPTAPKMTYPQPVPNLDRTYRSYANPIPEDTPPSPPQPRTHPSVQPGEKTTHPSLTDACARSPILQPSAKNKRAELFLHQGKHELLSPTPTNRRLR